jgi:hypothetical protein
MSDACQSPFIGISRAGAPQLEFVFEIKLKFSRYESIADMPVGAGQRR